MGSPWVFLPLTPTPQGQAGSSSKAALKSGWWQLCTQLRGCSTHTLPPGIQPSPSSWGAKLASEGQALAA